MALNGCDPCANPCIPGNISNDVFKQQVIIILCQLITAIENGGGEGGGGVFFTEVAPLGTDQAGAAPITYTAGAVNVIILGDPDPGVNDGVRLPQANVPMMIFFQGGDPDITDPVFIFPASGDFVFDINTG